MTDRDEESRQDASSALPGEKWRDAVRTALSRRNAERRRRGRHRGGSAAAGDRPGMVRRAPR